jgi:hypothetical protein
MMDEIEVSAETRRTSRDWFAFSLRPGEQILGYPIAGENEAFGRGGSDVSISSDTDPPQRMARCRTC